MKYKIGHSFPLGATLMTGGTNFALYSEHAEYVDLCLFDQDENETGRVRLKEKTKAVWHGFIPGIRAGQLYGYRVHGKYDPLNGHRFNYNKLLLDPYAKAIAGPLKWNNAIYGYDPEDEAQDLSFSMADSSLHVPKCIVTDEQFDWEDDQPLRTPYHKTIIYEAHVKGLTKLHPGIPEALRGTYAAIGHPVMISHLQTLGITAVELMPVHHFLQEEEQLKKGLQNYWGYNTIGFFAPHALYCSAGVHGQQVTEFKQMVKALHKAGIEVILDVVYNHTGEKDEFGPTVCFRGIDNRSYYRQADDNHRQYRDYTGTGNTLDTSMPYIRKMIMDSLRYWIEVMHVDGFRFDLAATLARELHEVRMLSAFFAVIHQDPVISKVKLIAEPWDLGKDGYQVGEFPAEWAEWNGPYRDCIRKQWNYTHCPLKEFAEKLMGSPDLYKNDYRTPAASINYIASHDGLTLKDIVSYASKHNEANMDDNASGTDQNHSANYGHEGETDDESINRIRSRQQRNMLTTLFLSQGVPMLLAGDEISNTQYGNNNPFSQDNELSWLKWKEADLQMKEFVCRLIDIRKQHPSLSRKHWFQGQSIFGSGITDIGWFLASGDQVSNDDWNDRKYVAASIGVFLNGQELRCLDDNGERMTDSDFLILFNFGEDEIMFRLPSGEFERNWEIVLSTAEAALLQTSYHLCGRSITLLEAK